MRPPQPPSTLFPYTTLFRSMVNRAAEDMYGVDRDNVIGKSISELSPGEVGDQIAEEDRLSFANKEPTTFEVSPDRKSTRLNSSQLGISYAVFCLKKKI